MTFERLSGEELEATLLRLRGRERQLEVQILFGLIELDRRKLYLDWGYGSLFAYCVERLGYCESSAGRRIAAARAMRRIPRIAGMLLSGEARLSTVAMAAGELARDESVLEEIRGKTQREVQEVLARRGQCPREPDRIRAVSDGWEFRFTAGHSFRETYERARGILSRKHPQGVACEQVFEAALEEYLKRQDPGATGPEERSPRGSDPPPSATAGSKPPGSRRRSRFIPTRVRRAVWRRDGGRCAYRSARGRRCGSRWDLEIDHVNLFCRGGTNREENLRLLCAAHNRREAERNLGKGWMRQFY